MDQVFPRPRAERPVPRYTSYPTALQFHDGIAAPDYAAALGAISPKTAVSLYVHIPYCREICWYCGCNTGALGRSERLTRYVAALEAEIAVVSRHMRGRVSAIHFGGGSPNVLPPDVLANLIATLRHAFQTVDRPEIAVEIDPRLAEDEYARAMAHAGVGRVSLGVQCFSPDVQQRINRVQPYAMVARAVSGLRDAGIAAINFDLLHGLPGQTLADVADTIAGTLALRPDRIAMFAYAHNPVLLPRQRMIDANLLPGPPQRRIQASLAHDLLVATGYHAIGFDHFALPTDPLARAAREERLHRNFQGFTADQAKTVIGFGASAISQLPGLLAQNHKHVGRYQETVITGELATARGVRRSLHDQMTADVIERLLCDGHVDLDGIAARHEMPVSIFDKALPRLNHFIEKGWVQLCGRHIRTEKQARPHLREIASTFDDHHKPACTEITRP